ncbi:hypothetical protein M1307_03275 [Patescibacteria group bacterium]|nr:hypothetical protein [Patescibacteria group bacterium]
MGSENKRQYVPAPESSSLPSPIKREKLKEWQRLVSNLKSNIEARPSYYVQDTSGKPIPISKGDFTGELTVGAAEDHSSYKLNWRCWRAFTKKYIKSSNGYPDDTQWALPTLQVEIPEEIREDEEVRKNYVNRAQNYAQENFEAIRTAIFETCEGLNAKSP